jgi:hypothetical protein
MKKVAGIDFSMTSPAICTYEMHSKQHHFYFYTDNKKLSWNGNFHGTFHKLWRCNEERFENIANWAMSVVHDCDFVWVEGYSYGSKGLVFHIGENTGVLKNKLWNASVPFDTFAPAEIKRWATGMGNAKKEHMETAFVIETGIDVRKEIGQEYTTKKGKIVENPSSDIIDSYFICEMGRLQVA